MATYTSAEKYRHKIIAMVKSVGKYLIDNAEALTDTAELHSDFDIYINLPNDTFVPTVRVTQEHVLADAARIWMGGVDHASEE